MPYNGQWTTDHGLFRSVVSIPALDDVLVREDRRNSAFRRDRLFPSPGNKPRELRDREPHQTLTVKCGCGRVEEQFGCLVANLRVFGAEDQCDRHARRDQEAAAGCRVPSILLRRRLGLDHGERGVRRAGSVILGQSPDEDAIECARREEAGLDRIANITVSHFIGPWTVVRGPLWELTLHRAGQAT